MRKKMLDTLLGISDPWHARGLEVDMVRKLVEVRVDFTIGTRFPVSGADGIHPVHDTTERTFRTLDLSGFQCFIKARLPRVKLPNGQVILAKPKWAGKLVGFTLKFEAMILVFAAVMPLSRVAELTKTSDHSVRTIVKRYADLAEAKATRS